MAKVCSYCGTTVPDDTLFCIKCGKKLEEDRPARICPKCGSIPTPEERFCIMCGTPIPGAVSDLPEDEEQLEPFDDPDAGTASEDIPVLSDDSEGTAFPDDFDVPVYGTSDAETDEGTSDAEMPFVADGFDVPVYGESDAKMPSAGGGFDAPAYDTYREEEKTVELSPKTEDGSPAETPAFSEEQQVNSPDPAVGRVYFSNLQQPEYGTSEPTVTFGEEQREEFHRNMNRDEEAAAEEMRHAGFFSAGDL